jgi:hypothetical protein
MLKKQRFLWKQLNGPQITAIMDVLWKYHVEKYDKRLDYFNTLSISTAENKHLSMIGKLMQFTRPSSISMMDFNKYIRFSYIQQGQVPPKADYGLSSGYFDYGPEDPHHDNVELSDTVYRKVLIALSQVDGFSRGLALIDDLAKILFVDYTGKQIFYLFEYGGPFEDITVRIKDDPGYNLIVFDMVCSVIFRTQPRVFFVIDGTINPLEE